MADQVGTICVTGASGQFGFEVLKRLRELEPNLRILAATRRPEQTPWLLDFADEVRQADFGRADTLREAFEGVDRLLIVSVEGPDTTRLALHRAALEAALASGVDHVFYAGFLDVDPSSPSTVARIHRQTEDLIARSGARFTALRNGPYLENMVGRAVAAAKDDGVLRWSAGEARLPFILRSDLALGAAGALVKRAPEGPLVFAGSQLLGFAELCSLVGARLGRPLRYEAVDDADFATECRRQGLSEEYVERRVAYGRAMRLGFMTALSDDFERVVGRPPVGVEPAIQRMSFD